ncbi:alpha/beta fold hydrolase [Pelagibius sp.]|uniref:alpha/beta fold hydrolase n=1 Tax=Pelagibius sp. TaxID=1931238 RepID=UPI002603340C|nr:alpha/beta fold hydrolase [Pelagibius sp.]
MRWGAILLVVGLSLAGGALAYNGWQAWQLRQPGFHDQDCWFQNGISGPARCGLFVVRENRENPDSRTIRLPVVIFDAQNPAKGKEPILYLTGGPGAPADLGEQWRIDGWWAKRRALPEDRDLIVMGQRGTGLKEPDFGCPEADNSESGLGMAERLSSSPEAVAAMRQALRDCAARLVDEGVDLTAYNSRQSAADIAELRSALGIESWTLYGVSYGSRLALSTLRYHPEGIRAAILDSVLPPESDWVLDHPGHFREVMERVFADCAADTDCTTQNGDLRQGYDLAVQRLSAEPALSLTLREIFGESEQVFDIGQKQYHYRPSHFADLQDVSITFDRMQLDELISEAFATAETRALIPAIIRETAAGRPTVLRAFFRDQLLRSSLESDISTALYLSHICRDELAFIAKDEIERAVEKAGDLGHLIESPWIGDYCEVWPSGRAEPVENTPVDSTVPVLLLAGRYDPITPPSLARRAAAHLANGYLYELDTGHGVLSESLCAEHLVNLFLEDLAGPPESACMPKGRLRLLYR